MRAILLFSLLAFIFFVITGSLLTSCQVKSPDEVGPVLAQSSRRSAQSDRLSYTNLPDPQPGRDIYTGKFYRYGPSIIVNPDNSIDAWFCALGDTYGTRYYDKVNSNSVYPVRLLPSNHASNTAAQKFTSNTSFAFLGINCPSWGDSLGSLVLSLYSWRGSYNSTLADASALLASKTFTNFPDNGQLQVSRATEFPAGDYIWVLRLPANETDASDKIVGVWQYSSGLNSQTSYLDGVPVNGAYQAAVGPINNLPEGYLDQITHQRSTNGGQSWSTEVNALKPTIGSADQGSVCDPSIAKWGGFYYMAYTGTHEINGLKNQVFVCRSVSSNGPWDKWAGSSDGSWGGSAQPIVPYSGSKYGIGEPSLVVQNGTIFLYYSFVEENVVQTQLVTSLVSYGSNWIKHLNVSTPTIVLTKSSQDSQTDVKYRDDLGRFQAIYVSKLLSTSSYIQLWESTNGTTFSFVGDVRNNIKPGMYNSGWSGDELGHVDPSKTQYLAYAYNGGESGTFYPANTYWQAINFVPVTQRSVSIIAPSNGTTLTATNYPFRFTIQPQVYDPAGISQVQYNVAESGGGGYNWAGYVDTPDYSLDYPYTFTTTAWQSFGTNNNSFQITHPGTYTIQARLFSNTSGVYIDAFSTITVVSR